MRKVRPRALSARDMSKERKFFSQSVSFPLRDAPPLELEEFWRRRDRSEINADHRWECLGPFSVAGRVTSLAVHPADPNFWVAGAAAGGVWISRDAGASWKQTWSRFATQSIGAVGWIELWDWCIVVATGEANMHNDYYPGSGLYYSMDNGLTWEGLSREPPGSALAEDVRRQPRRIGCLAFKTDPIQMTKDSYQMLMGGVYLDDRMPAGLYFRGHLREYERRSQKLAMPSLGNAQLQLSFPAHSPRRPPDHLRRRAARWFRQWYLAKPRRWGVLGAPG